jgi:hypothetical protein
MAQSSSGLHRDVGVSLYFQIPGILRLYLFIDDFFIQGG